MPESRMSDVRAQDRPGWDEAVRQAQERSKVATPVELPYRQLIPVFRLRPSPDNPRSEPGDLKGLEQSIRKNGLKQPLLVTPARELGGEGEEFFWIEDGWRRFLAMKDWSSEILCYVYPPRKGEDPSLRVIITSLSTAIHRQDLAPIDKARAYARMRDEFGLNNKEIAATLGITDGTVGNYLELLELSPALQERVWKGPNDKRQGTMQVGEARRLVRTMKRKVRARTTGGSGQAGAVWEPEFLTRTHPLGYAAEARCDVLGHNMRRRIGRAGKYAGACGECWQEVIKQAAIAEILERCASEVYKQDPGLAGRWRAEAQTK